MKKVLLISIMVLILFIGGCSSQSQNEIKNNAIGNTENTDKVQSNQQITNNNVSTSSTTTQVEDEVKSSSDTYNEVSKEETTQTTFDDSLDDCSLLTTEDIKKVCGVTTIAEEQVANINQGQTCIKMFKTDDPTKAMKIHYTGDNSKGTLDPRDIAKSSCDGMKAEMITDYSCYAENAGKSVFIYGKKRNVIIANYMPMEQYFICSKDQLKELGKLISDRLHS